MIGLTARQRELYQFIAARLRQDGIAPSFTEMAQAVGLAPKSKGRIGEMLTALELRGYVRRIPHKARAIELVPQGDAIELRPEVRAAALELARRTHTSLRTVYAEAIAAYVGSGGA